MARAVGRGLPRPSTPSSTGSCGRQADRRASRASRACAYRSAARRISANTRVLSIVPRKRDARRRPRAARRRRRRCVPVGELDRRFLLVVLLQDGRRVERSRAGRAGSGRCRRPATCTARRPRRRPACRSPGSGAARARRCRAGRRRSAPSSRRGRRSRRRASARGRPSRARPSPRRRTRSRRRARDARCRRAARASMRPPSTTSTNPFALRRQHVDRLRRHLREARLALRIAVEVVRHRGPVARPEVEQPDARAPRPRSAPRSSPSGPSTNV